LHHDESSLCTMPQLCRCFPPETESRSIHKVIDFVHDKVKNALELISREEKNKSLQGFFKELNDHTTNAFEFGKQFLAFLLCPNKKIGGNLTANAVFDGRTFETGKLHNLLESATNIMLESYVEDMTLSQQRVSGSAGLLPSEAGNRSSAGGGGDSLVVYSAQGTGQSGQIIPGAAGPREVDQYLVDISDFEESSLRPVVYIIEMLDPKGHRWVVRRAFTEFEALHETVTAQNRDQQEDSLAALVFPTKLPNKVFREKQEYHDMCRHLQGYLIALLYALNNFTSATQSAVCTFLEVKQLILSPNNRQLRRAESVPNAFVALKREFNAMLIAKEDSKSGPSKTATAAMAEFRRVWGIEMTVKVFDAYALLQRMATVLGWTLEINHFFISMFGNTLAFSKLPLRDIIFLQRDIMTSFLRHCTELFDFACMVNADSKYKWHKNLQMVENHLGRTKFHIEKSLALIALIDAEHLDYEVQMRRLRDVHARFQPLMNRIDGSLENIQEELSLPVTHRSPLSGGPQPPAVAEGKNNTVLQLADKAVYQPSESVSGHSSASQELQGTYIVEEPPESNEAGGAPVTPRTAFQIFSRDQSPDVPSQASNPLQVIQGSDSVAVTAVVKPRATAPGAARTMATDAEAKSSWFNSGTSTSGVGTAQDDDGLQVGEGECGPGSKVCVIS
jgi:hypothetical protein